MFRFNTPQQLSTNLSRSADAKNKKFVKKEAGRALRIRKVRHLPLGPLFLSKFLCFDTQNTGKNNCALELSIRNKYFGQKSACNPCLLLFLQTLRTRGPCQNPMVIKARVPQVRHEV